MEYQDMALLELVMPTEYHKRQRGSDGAQSPIATTVLLYRVISITRDLVAVEACASLFQPLI